MVRFPFKMPKRKRLDPHLCRHCGSRFKTRTALGGHARKMHLGHSEKYAAKRAKRESRVLERAVKNFAKAINIAMKSSTLDRVTLGTFKWI